jgi:hypothetical protein
MLALLDVTPDVRCRCCGGVVEPCYAATDCRCEDCCAAAWQAAADRAKEYCLSMKLSAFCIRETLRAPTVIRDDESEAAAYTAAVNERDNRGE